MPSRILIVDDDAQAARRLDEVLARQGYAIACVASGDAALEHLAEYPCDLVLLGGHLPGLTGYDACARIRERHGPFLPILMLIPENDADSARKSYDAGADDLLTRSVAGSALVLKIRGYLRSKALHDDLLRTREEAEGRVRDMALLNEISRDWSLIAEPRHFYRMVTQRLGLLIEAPICFIALYQPDARTLEAAVPAHGLPDEVMRNLRLEHSRELWNESRRAYVSNDARNDPRLPQGMVAAVGAESIVLVPMLSEGTPLGLIAAANKPAAFTEADVQLLTIFAAPAATFLRSRQIYEAQRRHAARLERLPTLMGSMEETTSRGALLELTTSFIQTELGYEAVGFYAPASDEGRRIECITVTGEWDPGSAAVDQERLRSALRGGVALQSPTPGGAVELTVPVGVGVHVQGVLKARRARGPLGEDEIALFTTIAGQLALALQRAESIAKTERLAKQMATLYDLALQTGPLRDLKRLFVEATEEAGRLIRADHVSALRFHPEDGTLRFFAAWARDAAAEVFADPVFRLGEGVAGRVARDWLPAMINDVDESGDFIDPSKGNPVARILCVPLIYFDPEKAEPTLFAVLNATRHAESPRFTRDELDYVQGFASQLSVAVANSMAYAAERERSEQLALVNAVIREIAGNLSRDRILEVAARRIHEAFRLALVMVAVPDRDAGLAHATMVAGPAPGRLLRQDYPLDTGIVGRALSEKRTILVADVSKDAGHVALLESSVGALAIPILSGDEVVAVLNVESDTPGAFGRSELITLETLADGIGIILRNAQLYGALEETNVRLVELDRLKSEVVNLVAHDFRSPLAGVLGHAEILESSLDAPAGERLASARSIIRAATHMANLVDKTLETTRLETGRLPLDFGLANLTSIVQDVIARRPADPAHPVAAEVPHDPVAVWADQERLTEVVENLLSNAAKYSPQGGHIGVRVRVADETVTVSVEDQGLGISSEDMSRLFRPFSRIRNPGTAGIEGSGLGLYICECIVRAHGGRLWAESQPGQGSVFSFEIPLYGIEAQAGRPVVLVAGDEGTGRDVRRVIEELGYAVLEVRDGVEAVESAVRLRPAAIVVDRILPRLQAEEVAERLREFPVTAQIPLFVLAAEEDLDEAAGLFRACLRKPVDRGRLMAALQTLQTPAR